MIGRGKAVCEVRGVELSGRPAFAMYLGVHLTYLSGVRGQAPAGAERVGCGPVRHPGELGARGRAAGQRAGVAAMTAENREAAPR